jgi:hypothetical protein
MKIRPLPDTDLARVALLQTEEKRMRLERFKLGRPTHSWLPLRQAEPAIFSAQKSLFDLPESTWDEIETGIRRLCKKNPDWLEPNLERAKLLFEFNKSRKIVAVERAFGAVPIGYGAKLKAWADFYCIENERPVFVFCDPRRGQKLTKLGRKFIFSAMKHNLATGDFAEASCQIFQFTDSVEPQVRIFDLIEDEIVDIET